LLRPVEQALALYFRPWRNDQGFLIQALTDGLPGLRGVVLNAARIQIQQELRAEAGRRRVETVLDTLMMELASPAARQRKELLTLGWAFAAEKQPHELMGAAGKETAQKIAEFVVAGGFSALLAPTHYLRNSDDAWIAADCWITRVLRDCLDSVGASQIPIYYPLALSAAAFRNPAHRKEIVRLRSCAC
jgi:hypothetical protein